MRFFTKLLVCIILGQAFFSTFVYAVAVDVFINDTKINVDANVDGDSLVIPFNPNVVYTPELNRVAITDYTMFLQDVDILAADSTFQKAKFYSTTNPTPQPLVIWLHTWSTTSDTLYSYQGICLPSEIIQRNWNYIQPNFRGANDDPEACASDKVITDIDEAIQYAITNGNVDESKIYVIGASGGGFAAINHFMRSTQNVVDAYYMWVPVTDLIAWFFETQDKGYQGYYYNIASVLQNNGSLNVEEAKRRSSIYQTTPVAKFTTTKLTFYAGIRDGYNGAAVPFSHSVLMFNKLVKDSGYPNDRVPLADMFYMIDNLAPPTVQNLGTLENGSAILYEKTVNDLQLIIFDGGHEMYIDQAVLDIELEIQ